MPLTFDEQLKLDVGDIFLQEFSTVAIFKSNEVLKEVKIQFFDEPLDRLETQYSLAWANFDDVSSITKNDTIQINDVVYGIVDFTVDELKHGVNIFLQKV